MTDTQIKGLRDLWGSEEKKSTSQDYCVRGCKTKGIIVGWISKERAQEYSGYYPGSTVELMPKV